MIYLGKEKEFNKNNKCVDCNMPTRNKYATRCNPCRVKHLKFTATGRVIGIYCKKCGKELSCKKSVNLLCKECYLDNHPPAWNKGTVGICKAWNKGKGLYKTKEEYRVHSNLIRRKTRLLNHKEKIADRIRTLIRNQIKKYSGYGKGDKTVKLLGCDIGFFIKYLENKFQLGMSWDNYGNGYGKWNIDHIIPVSRFDLFKVSEQRKAFNYKNCQPLWAIDNIKKSDKLTAAAVLTICVTI